MTGPTPASRVVAGAALLDEWHPGWARLIRDLHMDSCSQCVLGQIYGHFDIGVEKLLGPSGSEAEHGFDADMVTLTEGSVAELAAAYDALDALWSAEVERRTS